MKKIFIFAGLAVFLFFSCNLIKDFDEYTGVDLIAGKSFTSEDWQADRAESYYLNFEPVTAEEAGTTQGLPSGAEIYRLEIPNLVPNGDFEETNPGEAPAGWVLSESTNNINQVIDSGNYLINNNTLRFDIDNSKTNRIDYNLRSDTTGLLDGFIEESSYLVRFDIRSTSETIFEYNNNSKTFTLWSFEKGEDLSVRVFPLEIMDSQFTAQSGQAHFFSIGTFEKHEQKPQEGYIDNFRITRTDINQYIRLSVPVTDSEGNRLELLDGIYRFSVYIKEDPTHTKASATAPNRFPANGVSLLMSVKSGDTVLKTTVPEVFSPDDEGADWSVWSQISMTAFIQFDLPGAGTIEEQMLELAITPTDTSAGGAGKDVGSILIAAPSLEFLPDGE